jgi:hypothetical protein
MLSVFADLTVLVVTDLTALFSLCQLNDLSCLFDELMAYFCFCRPIGVELIFIADPTALINFADLVA